MKNNNLNQLKFFLRNCDILSGKVPARLHRRVIFSFNLSVFAPVAYFFLCVLCVKSFNYAILTLLALVPIAFGIIFGISYAIIQKRYIYQLTIMQNLKSTENRQKRQKSTETQNKNQLWIFKKPPKPATSLYHYCKTQKKST